MTRPTKSDDPALRQLAAGGVEHADDRVVAILLQEHCGAASPPDLTRRILAARTRQLHRASRRRMWLTAAMLVIGVAVLALAPLLRSTRTAQDPTPPATYLPLGFDAQWVYTDGAETVRERVLGRQRVGDRDVCAIATTRAGFTSYSYWAVDAAGVWRYPGDAGTPSLRDTGEPELVLALPPRRGAAWAWTTRIAVPAAGTVARVGPAPTVEVVRRAEIVDLARELRVPAGTFDAIVARTTTTATDTAPTTEHVAYVAGVGIVRRWHGDADLVLVEHTPGTPPCRWERDLPLFLAKHPTLARRGMPDSQVPVSGGVAQWAFTSEFRQLRWGAASVLVRARGSDVAAWEVFDPEDLQDWNRLVASEPAFDAPPNRNPTGSLLPLADLAGCLEAARSGLAVTGPFESRAVQFRGDVCTIRGALRVGVDRTLSCRVELRGREVVAVVVE